jgi:hypothetical protein
MKKLTYVFLLVVWFFCLTTINSKLMNYLIFEQDINHLYTLSDMRYSMLMGGVIGLFNTCMFVLFLNHINKIVDALWFKP